MTKGFSAMTADLTEREWDDLARYLDATRAELVFARRVLLVEGFAEQILSPCLVAPFDLDGQGVSVCAVHGVHFDSYVRFLQAIGTPYAVVTDGDPGAGAGRTGAARVRKLAEAIGQDPADPEAAGLFCGSTTLEADLFDESHANARAMVKALLTMPLNVTERTRIKSAFADRSLTGESFLPYIAKRKGRFAQRVASRRVAERRPRTAVVRASSARAPARMTRLSDAVQQLRTNEAQWSAFEEAGHCVVLAPPGSGKTQLLTTKLAYAFASGGIAAPRGAACITMTTEAALQLRRRLAGLGIYRRPNLFIGTVHSFALTRVVRPFARAAGLVELAESRLATDAEFAECFSAAFQPMNFECSERALVGSTMAYARQRLDLTGNVMLGGPRIAEVAHRTEQALAARRLYDFSDLVRHAVALIEDYPFVRSALSATYQRLYVDEYQDLAPGLDRIVQSIALTNAADTTLFAVGDPERRQEGAADVERVPRFRAVRGRWCRQIWHGVIRVGGLDVTGYVQDNLDRREVGVSVVVQGKPARGVSFRGQGAQNPGQRDSALLQVLLDLRPVFFGRALLRHGV